MDKSQISQQLINKLSGTNWDRVKDSVIGKELLAFGTEVIAGCTDVQDSLISAFDYKNTDKRGLISMSHVQEIGLSFQRPAYIKVQLDIARIVRPFGLRLSIGNITFYNKETVDTRYEVVLYQGSLNYTYRMSSDFKPLDYDVRVRPNIITIPRDNTTNDTLFNLGDVMPDSLLIYMYGSDGVRTLDKITPFNQGPTNYLYKPYVLYDGSFAFMLGNDVWGASLSTGTNLAVYWIKPDFSDVTVNVGDVTTVRLYTDGTTFSSVPATILEYSQGLANDINYARSFYQREYLQRQAIISKEQIKEWTNSHVDILDSSVVAINDTVYVYVKPTDPNGTEAYYEKYMADLDLYGALFVKHNIIKGAAVQTSIEIVLYDPITVEQKQIVQERLQSVYSYSNMKFTDSLDTSAVTAILGDLGIRGYVYIYGNETVTAVEGFVKLSFAPLRGSLKFYNSVGILIAWDNNGVIDGVALPPGDPVPTMTTFENSQQFGDFWMINARKFIGTNYTESGGQITPYLMQFNGIDLSEYIVWTSNGYAIVMQVYDAEALTHPTFNVLSVDSIGIDSLSNPTYFMQGKYAGNDVESCIEPQRTKELVIDGLNFYKASLSNPDNTITLTVYLNGAASNTVVAQGVTGYRITGSYMYKEDVYILHDYGVVLFRNVKTTPSASLVDLRVNGEELPLTTQIDSLHVFKDQMFALLTRDYSGSDSVVMLYYGEVIRVAEDTIDFRTTGMVDVSSIIVTDAQHSVVRNTNSILIFASLTIQDEQQTVLQTVIIAGEEAPLSLVEYQQSSSAFGSVNYETGELLCEAVISSRAKYRSVYAVPSETSYIEYTDDIIWTEQG